MVRLNPEIVDDVSVLKSKHSHVVLNEALTNTQLWASNLEIQRLERQLQTALDDFKDQYRRTYNKVGLDLARLEPKLTSLEYLKNANLKRAKDHIDFSFLN